MTKLSDQLMEIVKDAKGRIPLEVYQVMEEATAILKLSGVEEKALKFGDKAPDFTLSNQIGEERNLTAMLSQGALVISFYRGGW